MSSPERHERVGALLVEALEQPRGERGRFLDQACAGDDPLRREVDSLLRSHDAAGSFLEVPASLATEPDAESLEGRRVGPYRLIREIGRGGMGMVYLAARSDAAFEKRVAVKLVKRGMDTEEIVWRFQKERQMLAGLDHPNIARVLDGGTTDEGLPYFVMEYVDGLPILEFCDSRRFSISERLKLFGSVCSAVQFAHQNLIVHRDLKPSNILVDSAGVARLLDFGIAKLLAPDKDTTKTATGLRPMTPWYSSPEQIRGEPINTSSDVYSLGVLLYELLAGRSPYRIVSRAPTDVERAVCEEEPERPSVAVGRREEILAPEGEPFLASPESLSATREGDPKRLRRRLTGDLDTIVLLALRKDPRRRYGSVEQLSEDIRRHLAGLPIRARKDTLLYRGGKFIRRHGFGVAAGAVFALLAIGATATMAIQRTRIDRERLKAEQISAFLLGLFKGSDPREARGATLTVREMLDRGGKRIEHDLAGQPEVQATLMETIGDVYQELGSYESAKRMIESAYQIRRRIFGEKSLPVAQSLQHLGDLRIATGKYAEAESRLREALALRRQLLGEKDLAVAETLQSLGRALNRKGEYRGAEAALRSALSIRTELLGPRDLAVASTWNALGNIRLSLAKLDEAEQALRKALEIARGSSDPGNPSVAAYRNDLGILLATQGKFHEAAILYRESADARRRLVGEEHPSMAPLLGNLASALDLEGRTEEAEGLSRKALAMARRTLGDEHPNIGFAWNILATILRHKEDIGGAESAAGEALRISRANLPAGHGLLAAPLLTLGWARNAKGRPAQAEPLLREALEIRRKNLNEGDWRIAEAESLLGACLASQKRFDEASALLTKSYGFQKAKLGAQNRQTVATLRELITLSEAWGKPDQAQLYRNELALSQKGESLAVTASAPPRN